MMVKDLLGEWCGALKRLLGSGSMHFLLLACRDAVWESIPATISIATLHLACHRDETNSSISIPANLLTAK